MVKTRDDIYKELIEFKLPKWKDLPDFDIYMDQVVFYINQELKELFFSDEKVITSNMVNNYVKNSIVKPPIKKHYKRYHLAFLIVVSILKRCYSLNEISQLIEVQNKMEHSDLEKAYDAFSVCFEECLHATFTKGNANDIEIKKVNWQKQLLYNVVQSVVYKIYAEVNLIEKENIDEQE